MAPDQYTPTPIEVIVAAWKRGWSETQIAFACGVTRQAISLRLLKYEKRCGRIERLRKSNYQVGKAAPQFAWRCGYCLQLHWSSARRFDRVIGETPFCSRACYAVYRREISDNTVLTAIEMRQNGNSWKHVCSTLGRPTQSLQSRIWKYLVLTHKLTRAHVEEIWWSGPGTRPASWRWLELNTGIVCTETGAAFGPRYNKGVAWGKTLADGINRPMLGEDEHRTREMGIGKRLCTHCRAGHEFTPQNTYVTPRGARNCRTCLRMAQRRYADRRAQQRCDESALSERPWALEYPNGAKLDGT